MNNFFEEFKSILKSAFDPFSKEGIKDTLTEKGVVVGSFLLFAYLFVIISIFPIVLIIAPFAALNEVSKKWFRDKDNNKEREE